MLILNIDTADREFINLSIENDGKNLKRKKIKAHRAQAEKLLSAIEKLMTSSKVSPKNLSKIRVEHRGASFTSLRIGVLTANALAYALGIEVETIANDKKNNKKFKNFNIVLPKYSSDPDIKISKNKLLK